MTIYFIGLKELVDCTGHAPVLAASQATVRTLTLTVVAWKAGTDPAAYSFGESRSTIELLP